MAIVGMEYSLGGDRQEDDVTQRAGHSFSWYIQEENRYLGVNMRATIRSQEFLFVHIFTLSPFFFPVCTAFIVFFLSLFNPCNGCVQAIQSRSSSPSPFFVRSSDDIDPIVFID